MLRVLLLAAIVLLGNLAQAADINDVRLWRAPDHTRVVFDLSGPIEHRVISLKNPERLVVDIPNVRMRADAGKLDMAESPIQRLRHGVRNGHDLRVVFDLKETVNVRSFLLPASGELHDRLVIDFLDKGEKPRIVRIAEDASTARRDVIIAIDAGHGGEDPGAIGPRREYEKHVVFAIAQQLQSIIDSQPGYRAVMIRTGDYYIGLRQRRDLARAAQADLMVSIHADAFKTPQAAGASVYALSQVGATSASAAFLAQRENRADLVGGVTLSDKDDTLASVLTDLSMTASLDASLKIGDHVLNNMGQMARLHSRRVEQAGFAVLKSPDIPSILVETGFISNPEEARRLVTPAYQRRMAESIFSGINNYFRDSPPPGTYLAALKRGDVRPREHTIASGETLSGIAHRYNVSVNDLRRENAISGSVIRVGQKIVIPSS